MSAPALVSSNLTWEQVHTSNIGLDYSLLRNRLSGSFDYYISTINKMLVPGQQLPAVLGTTAPAENAASLKTKGFEFAATWQDQVLHNSLGYKISVGLSDYSSMITSYRDNPTQIFSNNGLYQGKKLGEIWGYQTLGFYQSNAEAAAVDNSALAGYTWLAGDMKYADLNHDGKINYGNNTVNNPGDQKRIGNSTPRYRFNINLSANYKNFDLTGFAQGVLKQDFDPTPFSQFIPFIYDEYEIPYKYATNRWTPATPNAYFARTRFAGGGNSVTQTKFLQNAAYLRVKQLTLGYSLPSDWMRKAGISRIRVYVTGANLFTITGLNKAFDPELLNSSTYPINKSVSFGLQATL